MGNSNYRKYGLTKSQYDRLRRKQRYTCAICGDGVPLSIDHDHDTGKVRGLLCPPCNFGLGNFRDDIRLLAGAIVYLQERGYGR